MALQEDHADERLYQIIPRTRISDDEEEQPPDTDYAARSCWYATEGLCEIWLVVTLCFASFRKYASLKEMGNGIWANWNAGVVEFGKEKSESLVGLSDKQIEETVTGLVKTRL